jgi:hypothetical protein
MIVYRCVDKAGASNCLPKAINRSVESWTDKHRQCNRFANLIIHIDHIYQDIFYGRKIEDQRVMFNFGCWRERGTWQITSMSLFRRHGHRPPPPQGTTRSTGGVHNVHYCLEPKTVATKASFPSCQRLNVCMNERMHPIGLHSYNQKQEKCGCCRS